MIFISHRGNIDGIIKENENNPLYIKELLFRGEYDVEIDVWYIDGKIMFGHDKPQYESNITFLTDKHVWCHAKNLEAFELLLDWNCRCFWHTDENVVLTSKKDIWVYPGQPLMKGSIAVLPETVNYSLEDLKKCEGICSDEIRKYKELLK